MYTEVGSFDAKAKLSRLLQGVKQGRRYTITLRGRPIADLIPSESALSHDAHVSVEMMRNMKKVRGVSAQTLTDWIAEGRR
jgi:prevent-host-death family protein